MVCEKGDLAGNLARMSGEVAAARNRGIDLVAFPEMSVTGYIEPERMRGAVLRLDGPEVAAFVALTADSGISALAGIVEANPEGRPFITQLVARDGALVAAYRKRQIVDEEALWFAPGPAEPVVFGVAGVPIGLAVCADIDAPEVYRDCAAAGARVIVHAAAPGLYGEQTTRDWASGYRWWRDECMAKDAAHARDNGVFVAVCTQAGRTVDEDFPGGGYLFAPDGRCLAETPDWQPCVLDVSIPLS